MNVLEHGQIHIYIFCFQTDEQELDLASLKLQRVESNNDFTVTPRQGRHKCVDIRAWVNWYSACVIKGNVIRRSHEVRVEIYGNKVLLYIFNTQLNNGASTLIQSHVLVNIT